MIKEEIGESLKSCFKRHILSPTIYLSLFLRHSERVRDNLILSDTQLILLDDTDKD